MKTQTFFCLKCNKILHRQQVDPTLPPRHKIAIVDWIGGPVRYEWHYVAER